MEPLLRREAKLATENLLARLVGVSRTDRDVELEAARAYQFPERLEARLDGASLPARDLRAVLMALLVLLDCGVRRAELGGIRIRDFDLGRRQLTVSVKGQKERVIPLRGRIAMALKAYLGEPVDLECAMEAFADARESEDAVSRGNDSSSRLD